MPQGDLALVVAELRGVVFRLEASIAELNRALAAREEALSAREVRIAELERLLEESRRSGKRQSAPFSKGRSSEDPAKPGGKSGEDHGRHGHRAVPVAPPDRELEAPLPGCCPDCGGDVEFEREDEQWQVDLPPIRPVVTRFRVQVGRCSKCRRRVQGRHPEQTSDALGAAGSQVGPEAMSWAHYLHYGLGLSFGKCAVVLGRLGIDVTVGALSGAAQATGTALIPVHDEIVRRVNASPVR